MCEYDDGYYEDKLKERVVALEARNKVLEGLLAEFAEIHGECDHHDHHGCCQTHFVQKDCIVKRAEDVLEELE